MARDFHISMPGAQIGNQVIGDGATLNFAETREARRRAPRPAGAAPAIGRPVQLFYSYAQEDGDLQAALEAHLALLQRQGFIQSWSQRRVVAGQDFRAQIDRHLDQADLVLLLVTSHFMASDYCYESEMKRALLRHQATLARVVPVILRPVDWRPALFGHLAPLPRDGKAVTSWPNQDEAWAEVAQGIREIIC